MAFGVRQNVGFKLGTPSPHYPFRKSYTLEFEGGGEGFSEPGD